MEAPPSAANAGPRGRKLWRFLLGLAPVLILITVVVRQFVQQIDGSLANILTLILGFCAWLTLTIGLAWSPWPRWMWRLVGAVPLVVIGIVLSLYRVVRLDGELIPQLESRWRLAGGLPRESGAFQIAPFIDPALCAATNRDFAQFLGPNRDGLVPEVRLASDWAAQPPRQLWKQSIGAGWSGFAVQGSVAVTLEQRDQEQWVTAYQVDTGKLFWHAAFPGLHFNVMGGAGPRATPTIDGQMVFAQTALGQVVCLELGTGRVVWQRDLLELAGWDQERSEKAISWGRTGSPLVVDDLLVVPLGGPDEAAERSLVAFNKADGEIVWRTGSDQISYSSPTLTSLLGTRQIVMVNQASVTGHDVTSGRLLWRTEWAGQSNGAANVSQTLTISQNQLLITKGYSQGAKLVELSKAEDGQWSTTDIWQKTSVLKTKFTTAVRFGDYIYALSDGTLECVQLADGKRQWKGGRYGHGQLLLVGDQLLITAEHGSLVLVAANPEKHTELAKLEVFDAVTWNVPALAGNKLLMRNADEAACYELPLATEPAT